MPVFVKGCNVYGQLKGTGLLVPTFLRMCEEELVSITYTYSLQLINDQLRIYCNQLENEIVNIDISGCGKVVDVGANEREMFVLNDLGVLFTSKINSPQTFNELKINPTNEIVKLECGSYDYNIAYSKEGNLFQIPFQVNYQPNIVSFKCGREHCILLDNSGNVLTFGKGSRGQLGHGSLNDEEIPAPVQGLEGITICQIAAGGWHSCAVSKDGVLYTWGWNGNGQIGNKCDNNVSIVASPHAVELDRGNVVKVACGSRHTLVLLDNGELYGCGWNKYKQIRDEDIENIYQFSIIEDLPDEVIEDIKCGPWNSAVICK